MNQSKRGFFREWFPIFCGTFYFSGIFGFVYETIFYVINNGALTRRGTTFGPWIQIYAYGGAAILILLYRLRRKPWLVFILSGLLSGVMEFAVGYWIYHNMDGLRPWDYNTEIWNWGNIGGYVCFRSVLVFALSGMLLVYVVIPLFQFMRKKMDPKVFLMLMYIPAAICAVDIFYNDVLCKMFPLMDAYAFYLKSGWYPIVSR